jgi:hypothetical protein
MAKIVKLNVMISASSKGMTAGISSAKKKLSGLSKAALSMKDKMGGAFTSIASIATKAFLALGAAVTAAGGALVYLAKQSIDAVGDTNDFAKSLGLTYNQLKAFQFAAGQAGVDAGKLDAAFAKMADTLGTAFGGNAAAVKAFEGIGLSIADLQKMSPAQQFEAIANAINKIQDPSVKMAAARDIFGKSGGTLISLFENAGQAIADAGNALDTFGVKLNQLDVQKVDEAGDKMGLIKVAFEGIGNQLALLASPIITKLIDDTTKWLESLGGVDDITNNSLAKMGDELEKIGNKLSYAAAWFDSIKAGAEPLANILGLMGNILPGGAVAGRLGMGATKAGASAIYDYGQEDVQYRANRGTKRKGGKGYYGKPPKGIGTRVSEYAQAANEEATARAQETATPQGNNPAVQAAIDQRMAEQRAMYDAQFGSTPGSRVSREREDPMLQVLRNIDANTGKNKIAFAGPN